MLLFAAASASFSRVNVATFSPKSDPLYRIATCARVVEPCAMRLSSASASFVGSMLGIEEPIQLTLSHAAYMRGSLSRKPCAWKRPARTASVNHVSYQGWRNCEIKDSRRFSIRLPEEDQ